MDSNIQTTRGDGDDGGRQQQRIIQKPGVSVHVSMQMSVHVSMQHLYCCLFSDMGLDLLVTGFTQVKLMSEMTLAARVPCLN